MLIFKMASQLWTSTGTNKTNITNVTLGISYSGEFCRDSFAEHIIWPNDALKTLFLYAIDGINGQK